MSIQCMEAFDDEPPKPADSPIDFRGQQRRQQQRQQVSRELLIEKLGDPNDAKDLRRILLAVLYKSGIEGMTLTPADIAAIDRKSYTTHFDPDTLTVGFEIR